MENIKAGSELPKGAGRSLLPHTKTNRDPTPSGASSLMRPVSDQMQFGNRSGLLGRQRGMGRDGHWD